MASTAIVPEHSLFYFFLQCSLSSIVALCNITMIVFVIWKRLGGQKEIMMTLFLCFSDSLSTVTAAWGATYRAVLVLNGGEHEFIKNIDCLPLDFPVLILLTIQYSPYANLLFSMEKVFMIYTPFRYRSVRVGRIVRLCIAISFLIFASTGIFVYAWSVSEPVLTSSLCMGDMIPISINNILLYQRVTVNIVGVIVYLPVIVKIHQMASKDTKKIMQPQMGYIVELRRNATYASILVTSVLLTLVLPDVIRLIFRGVFIKYQAIFFLLTNIKPLVNVFVAAICLRSILRFNHRREGRIALRFGDAKKKGSSIRQ